MKMRLLGSDDRYAVVYGMREYVLPKISQYFGEGDAYYYDELAFGLAAYPRSARY